MYYFISQITFSPLFAICNHLPFDLTMVATETNASGSAPTPLPECVLSGEGERTILCGLQASTWYHLSFKQRYSYNHSYTTEGISTVGFLRGCVEEITVFFCLYSGCEAVSEPTVSLSTFLLVHLPFSKQELKDEEKELSNWPYDDDETQ